MSTFMIAPSILAADFSKLGEEISQVEAAGADWIHVDVMDGHFVPNLTIGAPVVKSLRHVTKLPLDVHLMIEQPEKYVEDFAAAGADYLTIHVEATQNIEATLKKIKDLGMKAGLSLKPQTPVSEIVPFLGFLDLVLIMTVEPGFGGQTFMKDQLEKAKVVRAELDKINSTALLEVDGGVNAETVQYCKDFDVLVAGSFVFKNDYKTAVNQLKSVQR